MSQLNTSTEPIPSQIEKKLVRIQNLLKSQDNFWASEVSRSLLDLLEKTASIPPSEKYHIYNDLINVWELYIKSLLDDFFENWPYIYASYNQLFQILFLIKDTRRVIDTGVKLVKNLARIQFGSKEQIASVLESLAHMSNKSNDTRHTVELLYLTFYFRGKYVNSTAFDSCFQVLEQILLKLSMTQRPVLLYCFLDNAFRIFFEPVIDTTPAVKLTSIESPSPTPIIPSLGDISTPENTSSASVSASITATPEPVKSPLAINYLDFIDVIYRVSVNSIKSEIRSLRDGLAQIKRTYNQMKKYEASLDLILETVQQLQILNEFTWAFTIVLYYSEKLIADEKIKDARRFLLDFIEVSIKTGNYSTAFETYQYLAKTFRPRVGLFNAEVVQLWGMATKRFRELSDQRYFVLALEEMKSYLAIPLENRQFIDFCYAMEEYYRLKRGYVTPTMEEFWWATFHRAVFEEGFEDIATLCARKLKIFSSPQVSDLILNKIPETQKNNQEDLQISPELEIGGMEVKKINIILRIAKQKPIKVHTRFYFGGNLVENRTLQIEECWDDPHLLQMYTQIPKNNEENTPLAELINQNVFGKIAYLLLPRDIRKFNQQLKLRGQIPEMFIIIDEIQIPFEVISDQKTPFSIKYGIGYRFKEPRVMGISQSTTANPEVNPSIEYRYKFLGISDINHDKPTVWNDELQRNQPLFEYSLGNDIMTLIRSKTDSLSRMISQFDSYNSRTCTHEVVEKSLTTGQYHVILFTGSLFYIEESPLDSYLLTPDNISISIHDIMDMLSYAAEHNRLQKLPYIRPVLFFFGRILDRNFHEIPRTFNAFSRIAQRIDMKNIFGIFARISNVWNQTLANMVGMIIERLLLGESVGSTLVTANRQQFLAVRSLRNDPNLRNEANLLEEPHFAFFGEPWFSLEKI